MSDSNVVRFQPSVSAEDAQLAEIANLWRSRLTFNPKIETGAIRFDISRDEITALVNGVARLMKERDAMKADLFEARNALIKEGMERDQAYRDRDKARAAALGDAADWMGRWPKDSDGAMMANNFRALIAMEYNRTEGLDDER